MARFFRIAILMACILLSGRAFAAGGSCPSGANYTNPSNPTGSLVTLASLGIKSCYYIANAPLGSDSNNGTSESTPFLHSPGMQNCSGSCSQSLKAPGVGFIFRGGDTWHLGNHSTSPYSGIISNCYNNGTLPAAFCFADLTSGTSSSQIYIGVDITWFSGSSWARPIFTADNPLCNSSTANGTTCVSTTDTFGQPSFHVSSCPYQTSSLNNLIEISHSKYIILDSFEMTGLCLSHVGEPEGEDVYVHYAGAAGPLTLMNNYIHGSSHLQFAGRVASPQCTASNVCSNIFAFTGGVIGSIGDTVIQNVVDFSDSDPGGQQLCFGGFWNTAYNVFRYTDSCLPNPMHVFHDNLYEYFFENGHSNMIESNDTGGTVAVYNNVFRHVENLVTSDGGVGLWFGPASGTTDYIFNNLMYDVGNLEYLNIGGVGLTHIYGDYVFFNNTFQSNKAQPILRCHNYSIGGVIDVNNHYIDDQNPYLGPCSTLTTMTPLILTNAKAKAYGYTSASPYAYQPTSADCNGKPDSSTCTIGNGTNKQSYCSNLLTAASSDPSLSDAALACANDTPYACTYVTSTHSISCPARTVVARPRSTAWNMGAFESTGTQANAPNPPSNLTVVLQ
jgi:hypothetical protein